MLSRDKDRPSAGANEGPSAARGALAGGGSGGDPDPYQVEREQHKPLPPEPGSPHSPKGSPPHRAPAELPRGRRIALALDHDGCSGRAVRYACKLLLKSPDDQVLLVHVPRKGHSCRRRSSSSGRASPQGGGEPPGLAVIPGLLAVAGRGAGSGGGGGSSGSGSGAPLFLRLSQGSNRPGSEEGSVAAASEEGCADLLERCRQQLLAQSTRVRPERVVVNLLPSGKSPEKAITKLCAQEDVDILVLGTHGHASGAGGHGHLPGMGKLLSLFGGHAGNTRRYCQEHLPATQVVVLRAPE